MRPSVLLLAALAVTSAQASWFSSDKPAYNTWNQEQLETWLEANNINVPKHKATVAELQDIVKANWDRVVQWTEEHYAGVQKSFIGVQADAFDTWSESRLRDFLISQGVVEPKGTRDQLAVLAREKYRAYTSYSSHLSTAASTAVHGDATQQASKSATSAYGEASKTAQGAYDAAAASASSLASGASAAAAAATDSVKSAAGAASASVKSVASDASASASSISSSVGKSASSASKVASSSASSASKVASSSLSSASTVVASSASSASKVASSSSSSAANKASKSSSSLSKSASSASSSLSKHAEASASSASAEAAKKSAQVHGEL